MWYGFEILLPDKGVCNLVTINVCSFINDNKLNIEELLKAQTLNARAAYRMSTVILELNHWNTPNKEDKILGLSLTGWQDAMDQLNYDKEEESNLLLQLWETAFDACRGIAEELNDKFPVSFTCIKPEGSISLLPGVSAGLHYSHSPYYIRRVRINANDPLTKVCEELQYPVFIENGQTEENATIKVIEFPCKSPMKKTKNDITAIEQLENYKKFMEFYVDGNASVTVTVKEEEWEKVEEWLWSNWEKVVAISFLPYTNDFYPLMPYEEITKEEYEKRKQEMKPFVPSLLSKYEQSEIELDIGNMNDCERGTCSIR